MMKIDEFLTKKNLIALMLCIGLLQVAGYYVAGTLAREDGGMAVPQPDTLLYCQAARRIAEGHPFSFSAGEAMSTGTTSVLYPFVLAIPYILGAKGDALLTAGFVLNALFYLVFLVGWGLAIWAWLKRPWARALAGALVALFGQAAYSAMAQSDIGFWLAASGLLVAGFANGWPWLYGTLLILGTWIRPEGMVCVIAFALILIVYAVGRKAGWVATDADGPRMRRDGALVLTAILSLIGVFVLNHALTGQAQFSSVADKGYFKTFSFAAAIHMTAMDGLKMARGLLLGIPDAAPRDFYTVPILGAVALWIGVFSHGWRRSGAWREWIWILAVGGGFFTVAQSGWQNTNLDRYLGWLLPTCCLFIADGAVTASAWIPKQGCRALPGLILAGFAALTAVPLFAIFNRASTESDHIRAFAMECEKKLPPQASIGAWGGGGMTYLLSQRRFAHLPGIYSPEFAAKANIGALKILRNEPQTRFDYWILNPPKDDLCIGEDISASLGEQVLAGPDDYEMRKAVWTAFDASRPCSCPPAGLTERAHIDVGYDHDERQTDYQAINRYYFQRFAPFMHIGTLNGKKILDGGRVLSGGDAMTVTLEPGKNATVVMRTLDTISASYSSGISNHAMKYAFANPLSMEVAVNGKITGKVSCAYATNGFSDVSFKIPGYAIQKRTCRVEFRGDHIACGYWFYQ